MTPDDDAPVRLIARSDAPRRPRSTVDVHCALELELASGRRVPLLTDRGWSADGTWDLVTVRDLDEAAATVTGPDEPGGGRTPAQEETRHWDALAAVAAEAGVPVGAATLRELPLVGETSPELAALVDRAHREARALNRLLGVHPLALGTVAPAADADPELLHVVLLHTTAVVAGPPALVARLADADVSDLLDDASLGAHLRGPVEDVSAAWLHAADRQALSLDPDGGAAHVARHAELTAVLETRPVVVERVGMRDRDAQRAADAVGLRRVGRERVLRVAAP
ncbi:hypothetical protein CIT32_10770 [Micrococcus luteus]|uniref:hypothetical protein n=1 Tax=Micrococcus luteus TaxID=1270 RepID=UPI000BACD057|nr:hypothetical protein [Micrococcus luteus]PAW33371.1 hypothetical protein CIT32_10770 [Micrococcus luteus]